MSDIIGAEYQIAQPSISVPGVFFFDHQPSLPNHSMIYSDNHFIRPS
jgi:hypothetical protein